MAKKKFFSYITVILLTSLFLFIPVFADQETMTGSQNVLILPMYDYTANHSTRISSVNGQVICESSVTGYQGITTQIHISMTLERKVLLWWVTEESWSGTFNSHRGSMSRAKTVASGTYRVKSVFTVYNNNNYETITSYSSEIRH